MSPDALAAFVVGSPDISAHYPHEKLRLPARDCCYNRLTLLSGTPRASRFSPKKDHKPVPTEHQLIAVTTWKDETSEEHWNEVMHLPIKAFIQSFLEGKDRVSYLPEQLGSFIPGKFQECPET